MLEPLRVATDELLIALTGAVLTGVVAIVAASLVRARRNGRQRR